MKKLILVLMLGSLVSGCSTMEKFSSGDQKSDGVVYRKGSLQGIKIGDTVKAFQKDCQKGSAVRVGCELVTVGTLKVVSVEENSSVLKKESDFSFTEGVYLDKENSCNVRRTVFDPSCS